jgi:hypothetical protein
MVSPVRIRVPPPPKIPYLSTIQASSPLVTGLFCASECRCVPPGGCQRGCHTAPVAMPEDRSSSTDTPSARRVGSTEARRMPSSRKAEYQKLHCPGRVLPCRELLTSGPSRSFGWRSRLEQPGPVHSRSGPSSYPYSPECVEQEFSEVHLVGGGALPCSGRRPLGPWPKALPNGALQGYGVV